MTKNRFHFHLVWSLFDLSLAYLYLGSNLYILSVLEESGRPDIKHFPLQELQTPSGGIS